MTYPQYGRKSDDTRLEEKSYVNTLSLTMVAYFLKKGTMFIVGGGFMGEWGHGLVQDLCCLGAVDKVCAIFVSDRPLRVTLPLPPQTMQSSG